MAPRLADQDGTVQLAQRALFYLVAGRMTYVLAAPVGCSIKWKR
jgi:hypothetical protein